MRRFAPFLLALALVLGIAPGLAFASSTPTTVGTEAELTSALASSTITEIALTADIVTSAQVTVARPVTIDGAGHALTVGTDLGRDNSTKHALGVELVEATATSVVIKNLTVDSATLAYGVNLFSAAAVQFDKVTIKNSKGAGLTIGGSTLMASDLNTNGNAWGAVNVDPGVDATLPSAFTLTKGDLSENVKIWSDGKNVAGSATVSVDATAAGFVEQIPAPVVVGQPDLRICILRTQTVTFDSKNDSALATAAATYGSPVSAPSVEPTKTGYSFTGWATGSDVAAWDFSSAVNDDFTLYAQYKVNSYQVTFTSWNGWSMITVADYGSTAVAPEAFPRPGYVFAGWDHTLVNVTGSFTTTALYTKTVLVLPTFLSNPNAPSKMSHSTHYTIYGYLKPAHKVGSNPVRIYMYKQSKSGSWTSYGYVNARAYKNYSYTKYAASVRLRIAGKWRLRAYAPADAAHAAVWSSGYDYVTVK